MGKRACAFLSFLALAKELVVRWTCVVATPTTRILGLSRNKQGRKVEHLVKATSGDGAKMRGAEPTLLGQGPKLPPIRSKEELLLPIRNNRELLKTRHQRVLQLASCQPGLRGISRRRSLKRVLKRSPPVQDQKKSKSPREELIM